MRYSILYFAHQALKIEAQLVETELKKDFTLLRKQNNQNFAKKWIRRLFDLCFIEKGPQGQYDCASSGGTLDKIRVAQLELFCEIDDHLKWHQSLGGATATSTIDIVFLSFLRRCMRFNSKTLKQDLDTLLGSMAIKLPNLSRYLSHLSSIITIGFAAVDKKEQ